MRAVVVQKAGSYDQLRIETQPDPRPGPGEVLVRSEAIGVNYADVIVRMGLYASAKRYVGWPITPGFEVAGVVEAVGPGVDDLREGDAVFGVTRFGGYATHLVVPRAQLFRRPERLSPLQAATLPAAFLTAYYALFELAHPRAGETLLVHSAAGGVGGALVQLGKIADCRTVGVVGATKKVEVARALGADAVIDKQATDLWAEAEGLAPQGYDVVLDANGVSTLAASYAHLAPAGRLVVYGFHSMFPRKGGRPNWLKLAKDYLLTPRFNPLDMTEKNRSVLAFNLSFLFERSDLLAKAMHDLLAWIEAGRLAPLAVSSYPFDEVAQAHRDIESGQTSGKLALVL